MLIRATRYLKVYLQAELNIAWTDIHRAADNAEGVTPVVGPRPTELRRVRQVERLGAELNAQALAITKVLRKREIEVLLLIGAKFGQAAGRVPDGVRRGRGKRGRVEPALRRPVVRPYIVAAGNVRKL